MVKWGQTPFFRAVAGSLMAIALLAPVRSHGTANQGRAASDLGPADTVYLNAKVWTADARRPRAEAVAIGDGTFVAVGTDEAIEAWVGPDTQVVDLHGAMVMPGIIDSHIHPVRGALARLYYCNFPVTANLEEIQRQVATCASRAEKGAWIEGATWDSSRANKVTAKLLDEVAPENPVYLHDDTRHLGWLNSAALRAARIDKNTPDPPRGYIGRDQSGAPNGVLHDAALSLVIEAMPAVPLERLRQAAEWIFARLNAYGVTGVVAAQLDAGRLEAYRQLEEEGKLTVRVQGHWDFNTRYAPAPTEELARMFDSREKRGAVTELIDPDGVTIYASGVWLGFGSPFIDLYRIAEANGRQSIDQPALRAWVSRFDERGLKVMVHALGDLAVRNALDAVEAARRANGNGGPRHHIAHNTFVHSEDRHRFKDLNVVLEVSPPTRRYRGQYPSGFAKLLGAVRVRNMLATAALRDQGATIAYGSDWDNVPEPDPWLALQMLVSGQHPDESPRGARAIEQLVDLETAMEFLTVNGAWAMGLEEVTGAIEVNKDADMIVLDQNLFAIPVERIRDTRVLRTVLKGRTVYQRRGQKGV